MHRNFIPLCFLLLMPFHAWDMFEPGTKDDLVQILLLMGVVLCPAHQTVSQLQPRPTTRPQNH